MASKIIPILAGFPEKMGGEKAPDANPNGNSLVDSKESDEGHKGDEGYGVDDNDENDDNDDDDDDDDDSDDDIEYLWKEVGLPFISWLDSRITSYLETAPVFADFEAHQVHWQNLFSSLSKELEETNEASQQLTTPPMPELEIELLDAQHGKSCPCCLDEDRYSQGRIFALQEESGITKSVFIKLLGNALYAGRNLENYRLFRDVYEGRLVIEGFDWIMGSPCGDLWGVRPSKFPRLYIYCIGKPVAAR